MRVHRARNLVDVDRALRERIPVTSLARTLLDLAEVLKPKRLDKALEAAEKLKQFDGREARAVCERSRAHRGSKRLLAALGAHRPTVRVLRSDVERDFLALLETSDLPLPASNYFVGEHEIDAYWPDLRFGVELDTFATHGSPLAFEADRERDAKLLEVGITTIRVTDLQLQNRPDELRRRLAVLLG